MKSYLFRVLLDTIASNQISRHFDQYSYSDLLTQISASTVAIELTRTTVLTDASDEELRLEA